MHRPLRFRWPGRWTAPGVCLILISTVFAMPASADDPPYFDMPFGRDYEVAIRQRIVDQIEAYLHAHTARLAQQRQRHWNRDISSADAYAASVRNNRERLRRLVGAVDDRVAVRMEVYAESLEQPGPLYEGQAYSVFAVRWPVLEDVAGEGLLVMPAGPVRAAVVALPDADQAPEALLGWGERASEVEPMAAALAEQGVAVVVPVLISRDMRWAQEPRQLIPVLDWMKANDRRIPTHTNLRNRELLWRQTYLMGRHIIGYELQRAYAALDWFQQKFGDDVPLALAGYGEGGLLALYGAALDERVGAALVSGYFGPREAVAREPNERLIWGLLKEFGDAEIASLVAPRGLVLEYSRGPEHEAVTPLPPPPDAGELDWFQKMALRAGGPGVLTTPPFEDVAAEVRRLRDLLAGAGFDVPLRFIHGADGATVPAGSGDALAALLEQLGLEDVSMQPAAAPPPPRHGIDAKRRHDRVMDDLIDHLLAWARRSSFERYRHFQGDLSSPAAWDRSMQPYRRALYDEIVGRLPDSDDPPPVNVRQRQVFDAPRWSGHEVIYDALPGVWGFGVLAVPKDIADGERRPLVVLQHGYGGMPGSYARDGAYRDLMSRLCQRGFVVFAAHLPFNMDEKNGIPVGATMFSFGVPQYQQALRWLKSLDVVDEKRIGYYGLSYGGRAAMYLPPLIPEFKFAVSSASFSRWPQAGLDHERQGSSLYHERIGPFKFGLGTTFGRAELGLMIAPRGFVVENGYHDTAVVTEDAGHEYAKIRRVYDLLGIGERAQFNTHIGGHEAHLDTLLPYIHRMLEHPVPAARRVQPPETVETDVEAATP